MTERRRAETALLRERRLFIGGPTVVFRWVAAEGWPVEYVSPNVEGVFGYSTEDFVSGRVLFASVIHPDDLERIGDEVTRHSHAGVPFFEQEYRIVRPDGEVRWVYDFTVVARDEGGTITHYEGYVLDATDRKSAEASLRDSERRYRTMVQQSPLSIVIYEPDGTPRVANPAFRKLWGVSEQDYQFLLANYNVLEDEALEDLGITAYLRRAFRGEPVVIPEELYDPADSTVASQTGLAARRIRAYAYPVTDEDAQIREVVLIHEDVTAQRQAEADQARLATAIDQAAEAVVVTNAGGAIQYVNPAFERITGYSREEAIGQNPRILKSGEHDESFYKEMWDTLRRGDAWSGQIVNKRRDGTLYTEDAVISPVRNTAGLIQNFVAVKRDVTREVQLEEQLRESQRLDAIGQLAGGVAHDFNNILTAILGNVELSLDELRAQVPPAAGLIGALEQIEESAQRASRITQQLLTFGRRQTIQSEVINLSRVLADLESMLRRLIPESVALEVGSAAELDAVRADSGQIEQVIVNLVLNAADAMPQGGQLTIAARNVELSGDDAGAHLDARPGRYVVLSVSDTGCGMDQTTRDRVFEPFFTTKGPEKGTGLGLATVHGIVKKAGGHIHVYSEPRKGSTFEVCLPAVEAPADERAGTRSTEEPLGGDETVLLCEDDAPVRDLLAQSLRLAGYTVLVAAEARQALALAERHGGPIDLLVTDVIMPHMNGRELADTLHAVRPGFATLFISGYPSNVMGQHGAPIEDAELLEKPFTRERLLSRIRQVLARAALSHDGR